MSDFKEVVDYFKFNRRGEKASKETNYHPVLYVDENYNTAIETDITSVLKSFLSTSYSKYIGNEIADFDFYFRRAATGHLLYYIKENVDINPRYRRIPMHLNDQWETLPENEINQLILIKEGNNLERYFDKQNEIVFEIQLREVIVFSDYFLYHPNDIKANEGEHTFDFKNHEGYDNSASDWALRLVVDPWYKTVADSYQMKVELVKKNKSALLNILPKIKKNTFGKYIVRYIYYEKGIKHNSIMTERAVKLKFNFYSAFLEYLNQTIFYFLDNVSYFESPNRKLFLDDYLAIVYSLLKNAKGDDILKVLYYVPIGMFEKIKPQFIWAVLDETLKGFVTNAGINKDDIVLRILEGLAKSTNDSDKFLEELLKNITPKETRLSALFYRIDGQNYANLIKLLWRIWTQTKFIYPDVEKNPDYKETTGPLFLPYRSEKSIGFYFTSLSVDKITSKRIKVEYGTGEFETVTKYTVKDNIPYQDKEEVKNIVFYHPYHPVYLVKTDNQQDFAFEDLKDETIIPMFLLYINENKSFWQNWQTAGEYAVDILTTVSGVGNLAKFRHLTKLNKLAQAAKGVKGAEKVAQTSNILRYIKGAAGVVELSSGSLNFMLKITDKRNESPYKELSEFLFYLELLTLTGELTAPLKVGLKKSAKEAIEKSDGVLRKQYDELFGELYKVANIDSKILLKNKEFVKHLEDLQYGRIKRVYPNILSLEQEAVLRFYTTNVGYKNFNKALRGEIEMTDEFLAQEQLMNQALDKLPNLKTDALLYRIENLTDVEIKEYYKVGEEVTNKHFTSSSYDMFSIGEAMRKRKFTVLIRIETKTGKLIQSISTYKDEGEVLFKSNTTFYVDKFTENINPLDPFGSKIKAIIIKEK